MIGLSLYLFYYLVIVPVHLNKLQTTLLPFNNTEFASFVLSVILLAAAGNIINDYFDFELDKEFKPGRPLPLGLMSLDAAMYLHMFLVLCGIGLGFYLGFINKNFHLGYLYVVCALLLYIYSSLLKKIPLVGNFVVAGLSAFVFVILMLFELDYLKLIHAAELFDTTISSALATLMLQLKFYAGFAFLTSMAREVVKDMEDREGDAEYKINTFAVEYGDQAAKWLTIFIMLMLISGVGYFMVNFFAVGAIKELAYLGVFVELPLVIIAALTFMANGKKDYARISMVLKLIMLLGILSIPAFYLFAKMA